ncbi:protein CURVATURE THYLAKOID 1C, chloroplastic [Cucurbita maxima]|uniref:Protein CURVATURE THYLAKOID 1C, chloroplastic n=1 Tax=Cucurbita maxima TaxID=3661 RepID=A0A6J1KFS9_CUCMA|nr:protein CURVATURE THYLAKOID 1C, chloroplastic [Cucurbita maxima]XP_023000406.1 protein CURVATURE THYLAKOID 1C, chloroplastic [Cucurbita maxima]
MASIFATLPPPLLAPGKSFNPLFTYQKITVFPIAKGRSANGIVKAIGDSSESSTSIDIIKSVRNVWDQPEDRLGLFGLGFAAVVGAWTATNLVTAVDKLPLLPGVLEFIGILVSWWFVYRYLLFKPNREELLQIINKSVADVLGQ